MDVRVNSRDLSANFDACVIHPQSNRTQPRVAVVKVVHVQDDLQAQRRRERGGKEGGPRRELPKAGERIKTCRELRAAIEANATQSVLVQV